MSARQQRNVQHLLIGGTADISVVATDGLGSDGLDAGEIGAFTPGGLRIVESNAGDGEANATAGMEFYLALGESSPLKRTPVINGKNIKKMSVTAYTASTEQLDYIGYNGTSGSFEAINSNLYMVDVYVEDFLTSSHDGRYIKHLQYKSDSSAAQSEIALGLADSGFKNWSRESKDTNGDSFMAFTAICNDAGVACAADASAEFTHLQFTRGSQYVTGTDSVGIAALGTDEFFNGSVPVANDFLRAGTTVTSDMYKVESVTVGTATAPLTVKLTTPYRGATTRIAVGSTEYVTAALGAAADWGISMSGVDKPFVVGKEHHEKIRFSYSLGGDGFGTTTTTSSTTATEGVGEVNDVAELEWFCAGNQGEFFRMGEPNIHNFTADVDSSVTGGGYDFIDIVYEDNSVLGIGANPVSQARVTLATPATQPSYMQDGTTDDLTDVLEAIGVEGVALAAATLDTDN